jgi:predicted enzyme related to lactoylglutathione lyase
MWFLKKNGIPLEGGQVRQRNKNNVMKRVTGIGGIFFKCEDPNSLKEWYQKHLGIKSDQYGGAFRWRKYDDPEHKASTAWSPFPEKTDHFEPSKKEFMINYRVENLKALLPVLKEEWVQIVGAIQSFEYGHFAHILDEEGNKIELWEPIDSGFDAYYKDQDVNF